MKILSIETTTEACSAALLINKQVIEKFEVCPRQHSGKILSMAQSLLDEAGVQLINLDGIAVSHGPGSFTGVRLGLSVAQGLAYGAELPILPISTLKAVVYGCLQQMPIKPDKAICAMDARKDQVYFAGFEVKNEQLISEIPEQVISPESLDPIDQMDEHKKILACGHGFKAYKQTLLSTLKCSFDWVISDALPHAQSVALLGAQAFTQNKTVAPENLKPIYLRNEVVHT